MQTIKGFPDYKVDPSGNVWSFIAGRKTANGEIVPKKLSPIKDKSGRLRYTLVNTSGKFTKYASDLVISTYVKPKKRTQTILHANGDLADSSLENLEVVEKKDLAFILMQKRATPEQIRLTKNLRKQIRNAKTKEEYVIRKDSKAQKENVPKGGKGGKKV